jgi:hypothetical protein
LAHPSTRHALEAVDQLRQGHLGRVVHERRGCSRR